MCLGQPTGRLRSGLGSEKGAEGWGWGQAPDSHPGPGSCPGPPKTAESPPAVLTLQKRPVPRTTLRATYQNPPSNAVPRPPRARPPTPPHWAPALRSSEAGIGRAGLSFHFCGDHEGEDRARLAVGAQ
ncbi:hypothetical protein P7K49_002431 [Saguinus oedipus]|uniref:Uncharacterized protein n=1 Tax=Saguinus oedipus TaxID=9490 RepID=A0ABQ9WHW1_SAGOE|nr:hypothetical protein P7K49_002431 [Saguinus oedipus]